MTGQLPPGRPGQSIWNVKGQTHSCYRKEMPDNKSEILKTQVHLSLRGFGCQVLLYGHVLKHACYVALAAAAQLTKSCRGDLRQGGLQDMRQVC